MYVCMYVCVYINIILYIHIYIYIYIQHPYTGGRCFFVVLLVPPVMFVAFALYVQCPKRRLQVQGYRTWICMYIDIHIYIHIHVSLSLYIYIYICMCVYAHIYIYIYIRSRHPSPAQGTKMLRDFIRLPHEILCLMYLNPGSGDGQVKRTNVLRDVLIHVNPTLTCTIPDR